MLRVNDLEKTIGFYCDLLGFKCTARMEGWAILENHDVELMVALPNQHEPFDKPCLTGSLYFHPEDVDALWEQLKEKTVVVYPLENFDYGMREFAVLDNNGYCLQFGKEI